MRQVNSIVRLNGIMILFFGLLLFLIGVFAAPFILNYSLMQEKNPCISFECIIKPVQGYSMDPTIRDGDSIRIAVDYYSSRPLQRNDIIIIDFNVDNSLRVKRVIGLPRDRIHLTTEGNLAVNGVVVRMHPFGSPFTPDSFNLFRFPSPSFERIVPEQKIVAVSDNIEYGFDSLDYGFVDASFVRGKVITIFPLESSASAP